MDAQPTVAERLRRRRFVVPGVVAVLLAVAIGGLLWLRGNGPLAIDDAWMRDLLAARGPVLTAVSEAMNALGGGWFGVFVVPIGVGVAFLAARRPIAAVVFVLASAASAGLVQLLKAVFGRERPDDILVAVDPGSFPSGHVANAATIAVVLGLLLSRWWVWAAGAVYAVAMALSRTYLGAHWLSDTAGGLLLGAGVGVLVWVVFAELELAERRDWRRRRTGASV